jgi:hypothetical protein
MDREIDLLILAFKGETEFPRKILDTLAVRR